MWFIAVDDLFKEANIEPNGKVKYDEFIHKITIPVWDYWIKRIAREPPPGLKTQTVKFLKRKGSFTLGAGGARLVNAAARWDELTAAVAGRKLSNDMKWFQPSISSL